METQVGCVYAIYNKVNRRFLFGETKRGGRKRLVEHMNELRRGEGKNKLIQSDYLKYGESRFNFEVIIETKEHKLYELLLIELFSRIGKNYNERRGDKIKEVERGEKNIPICYYEEIEDYLHKSHSKSPYYKELLNELEDMKTGYKSKSEKIYNKDFKNAFLTSKYGYDTQRVVKALFRNTEKFETLYGKDLYDFNQEELNVVLKSFKITTIRSLQNQVSAIDRYIEFAKEHQKTAYRTNQAKEFKGRIKIESLLDKEAEENMIFDKEEIMEMAMSSDNAQDGVIFGLLFDGISTKKEFEELTDLNKRNINMNSGEIKLSDRIIPMSKVTTYLVSNCLKQGSVYTSIKGNTTRTYKIADGDNVLRGLRGKSKVKGQIISQRMSRIAEINDYGYLNATNISYSGQLHYAKQLIIDEGNTVEETIPKVLHRFGVPNNSSSRFYLRERIDKYSKKGITNNN